MPAASASSTDTSVGIAIQNYHSSHGSFTAPTTFYRLNLTEFDAIAKITMDDADDEQDGSLFPTSPGTRLGVYSAIDGQGRMRPKTLGYLLKAAGFTVSTEADTPVTGAYTHTFTPATTDATFPWATFYELKGVGGAQIKRVFHDTRLARFAVNGNRNAVVTTEFAGNAGHEQIGPASGDTLTADTDVLIRTVEGSFSLTQIGGGSLVGAARSVNVETVNEFPSVEDNFVIADHEFDWQTWLAMMCTGTVDVAFSKTLYEKVFFGGTATAGTGINFAQLEAALDVTYKSATMITGTTPYSFRVEVPYAVVRPPDSIRSSGRSEVRMVLPFRAYKYSTNPLVRYTMVNATASY